jgi:hypothetical protein
MKKHSKARTAPAPPAAAHPREARSAERAPAPAGCTLDRRVVWRSRADTGGSPPCFGLCCSTRQQDRCRREDNHHTLCHDLFPSKCRHLPVPKQESEGRSESCGPGPPAPALSPASERGNPCGKEDLLSQSRPFTRKLDASASATGKRMICRVAAVNGRALQVDGRGAVWRGVGEFRPRQTSARPLCGNEPGGERAMPRPLPGRRRWPPGPDRAETLNPPFDNPRGNTRRVTGRGEGAAAAKRPSRRRPADHVACRANRHRALHIPRDHCGNTAYLMKLYEVIRLPVATPRGTRYFFSHSLSSGSKAASSSSPSLD